MTGNQAMQYHANYAKQDAAGCSIDKREAITGFQTGLQ
jgi:hypothetical protein